MSPVKPVRKGAGGRPRLLSREQVIETALTLGLENLTMKRVADELGVTIATLYQYVADRDEMMRLAVGRVLSSMPLPEDAGQHWSIFIRDFADAASRSMGADAGIIARFLEGGVGLEPEAPAADYFLQCMTRRGFSLSEATDILRLIGGVIFGAAMVMCRDRARSSRDGSPEQALRAVLAQFAPDELPLLRQVADAYAAPMARPAITLVEPLIRQIAQARGEEVARAS